MVIKPLKPDRNARFSVYVPSLQTAEETYIPFDRIARQFRSAIDSHDSQRIDRLWNALCRKHPVDALQTCLGVPCPYTHKCLLTFAIENENTDVVAWLLGHGCEDYGMTMAAHGDTPLHTAARHDCAAIIAIYHQFLYNTYDDQADNANLVDWRNSKGETPLAVATKAGAAEATNVLLTLGASLESSDADGNVPLHHAAAFGHKAIVETLIRSGAAALVKNDAGYTASELAYSYETDQVLQNAVRSALEANKRARTKTAPSRLRGTYTAISGYSDEDTSNPSTPVMPTSSGIASRAMSAPPIPLNLQKLPPVAPKTALRIQTDSTAPLALGKDDPSEASLESSKALQRIIMRDAIAQDHFKDRSMTISSGSSSQQDATSPQIGMDRKSSISHSLRREGSNTSDTSRTAPEMVRIPSSSSSSIMTPISPDSSGLKPLLLRAGSASERYELSADTGLPRPIPAPPLIERQISRAASSIPTLTSIPASPATSSAQKSSFFGLRKSSDIPPAKRSLKHHASLADLRSTAKAGASVAQTIPLPMPSPNLPLSPLQHNPGTKTDFFSSRKRAGT